MSCPLGFLASNTHMATTNPKFRTEKNQNATKTFLFWSLPDFGGKIPKLQADIEPVCDENLFLVCT